MEGNLHFAAGTVGPAKPDRLGICYMIQDTFQEIGFLNRIICLAVDIQDMAELGDKLGAICLKLLIPA